MKKVKYDDYDAVMLPPLIMPKNLSKNQIHKFPVGMLFEGRRGETMIFWQSKSPLIMDSVKLYLGAVLRFSKSFNTECKITYFAMTSLL